MRIVVVVGVLLAGSAAGQSLHLVPMPREVSAANVLPLSAGIRVDCAAPCDAEDAFAVADFKAEMAARRIATTEAAGAPHVFVTRFATALGRATYAESLPAAQQGAVQHGGPTAMPAEMEAEGYVILPDHDGVAVTADTSAGIFYALQTVKQLVVGDGAAASLQVATVRDWPAMKVRGLHDDLSRGPIDTLEFQKKIVRTIAEYKDNLYSPYFETTQQYASNPLAGVPGFSLTAEDARQLVAYAKQFHVMVVPEQEAFGHLRHMLVWEKFADVAETPHGAVLSPGAAGSIPLIDGMFKELAALYPSPYLHIGGDETVDLGLGRTKAEVDARGLAPVYLDFVQQIVTDLQPLHRKILFWGDVAQDAPALLKAMPQSFKDQTIAVAWGYSPNPKGFASQIKPFTEAGIEVWVAPAINNYRQVWPNQQLALDDIQEFTRDGQRMGATGQLNTLWDDDGESLANMNWYGILFGCAAAWQAGEASIPAFQESFGVVFHGDASGLVDQAQDELTAAMTLIHDNKIVSNTEGTDTLFWVDPWSKDGLVFAGRMRPIESALRLHAEHAITLLAQARAGNPMLREQDALDAMDFGARRIDFLALNFQLADEMEATYARAQVTAAGDWKKAHPGVSAQLSDINGVNGRLQDLTYGYSQMRDMYEQEWLRSYRPANLRPVLERFDFTIGLWLGRVDKVRSAQRQWVETHVLPGAGELGIPVVAAVAAVP